MDNGVLSLQPGLTASALILAVSRGLAREIACFGPPGEGKTISALMAMSAHSQTSIYVYSVKVFDNNGSP